MSKFKIIFDGYEEPEEYDSYDEALEAADVMASNFQLGASILYDMNPGDYAEENDGDGSYVIIEVDDDGIEIDRYE
jgi:hypothetical protein